MLRYLLLLCSLGTLLVAQSEVQHLQDVKKIYVVPVQGDNVALANLLSAKLVSYLAKQQRVTVVDSEEAADAVLVSTGRLDTVNGPYGEAHYRLQGAVHLASKDGVILWADDLTNSRFARSATSSFAERVARKLSQAITEADRKQ
jgi:hypothetical protein